MNNEIKVLYCGECPLFLNENIDGSGQCKITQELTHCGDSCELEFLNKQLLAEQTKNKKLVEVINSIVKYCAKTDTIEWFDYDNIKGMVEDAK